MERIEPGKIATAVITLALIFGVLIASGINSINNKNNMCTDPNHIENYEVEVDGTSVDVPERHM